MQGQTLQFPTPQSPTYQDTPTPQGHALQSHTPHLRMPQDTHTAKEQLLQSHTWQAPATQNTPTPQGLTMQFSTLQLSMSQDALTPQASTSQDAPMPQPSISHDALTQQASMYQDAPTPQPSISQDAFTPQTSTSQDAPMLQALVFQEPLTPKASISQNAHTFQPSTSQDAPTTQEHTSQSPTPQRPKSHDDDQKVDTSRTNDNRFHEDASQQPITSQDGGEVTKPEKEAVISEQEGDYVYSALKSYHDMVLEMETESRFHVSFLQKVYQRRTNTSWLPMFIGTFLTGSENIILDPPQRRFQLGDDVPVLIAALHPTQQLWFRAFCDGSENGTWPVFFIDLGVEGIASEVGEMAPDMLSKPTHTLPFALVELDEEERVTEFMKTKEPVEVTYKEFRRAAHADPPYNIVLVTGKIEGTWLQFLVRLWYDIIVVDTRSVNPNEAAFCNESTESCEESFTVSGEQTQRIQSVENSMTHLNLAD